MVPTLAPCSANAIALAAPMPFGFPAPVTMATFPFKDCEAIVSGWIAGDKSSGVGAERFVLCEFPI